MTEFSVGDVVEVRGDHPSLEKWNGYRGKVVEYRGGTPTIQGLGPRPDGISSPFIWPEDLLKRLNDFRVGDRVRVTKAVFNPSIVGAVGVVTGIEPDWTASSAKYSED